MLIELHIRNIALIDEIVLELGPGLNVLTGETGAGKSILVDSLQLAVGGRSSADIVRSGQELASVTAVFQLPEDSPALHLLRQADLSDDTEPGHVILRRDVQVTGRSRAWINGRPVTVSQLQAVGEQLVDVHGQHDHQSLLRARTQLELLDAYGGTRLVQLREQFARGWAELVAARQELVTLLQDERERARRLDLVRFQIEEIDDANLDPNEEERLKDDQNRLVHLGRLQRETAWTYEALSAGEGSTPGAADVLQDAAHRMGALAEIDPDLRDAAEWLEGASVQAREAAGYLRAYVERLDADPQALEAVAARLALLSDLKRKYGADVAEILRFADGLREELKTLEGSDEREEQLRRTIGELEQTCAGLASQLSDARRAAATRLEQAVSEELEGLHMGPGRFCVEIGGQPTDNGLVVNGKSWQATATGIDTAQYLLSANPGEPPRALARIASGGELSRVALALKRSLIAVDEVPTLVFDEIDAGIGGETAQAVARRLDDIGRRRQVICVTHLAQIATAADRHLHIRKEALDERTVVHVAPLNEDRRVEEIARMLAGVLTDGTLDNARELLLLAQKTKSAM